MSTAVPQPRNLQLELLIKLLKMTTSSSDGEALLAARKANDHIKKMGVDWDDLLRGKVTVMADPFMTLKEPPTRQHVSQPPPAKPAAKTHAPPPRPTPPPSSSGPGPTIKWVANQYAGRCTHCQTHVDVGRGFASRPQSYGNWQTSCQMDDSCRNDPSRRASQYVAPKPAQRKAPGKVKFGSKDLNDLLNKIQP